MRNPRPLRDSALQLAQHPLYSPGAAAGQTILDNVELVNTYRAN
jgi:hypothetical protein